MTKERPILFNDEMIRAVLDGRKSQTRRVVKLDEFHRSGMDWAFRDTQRRWHDCNTDSLFAKCPFGTVGDRLWVREAWAMQWYYAPDGRMAAEVPPDTVMTGEVRYRADGAVQKRTILARDVNGNMGYRPSIHMPKWASRITLEITGVRVERVRDISEEDARAEGSDCTILVQWPIRRDTHTDPANYRDGFRCLWYSLHAKKPGQSWAENPWVWVLEFKRVTP